jgi:hypothetical protein
MDAIERVYRNSSTESLKAGLADASVLVRDYARACGDRSVERALRQTIDMMLDELLLRGEL